MRTREELKELGYTKKRSLTHEEKEQLKIGYYYFNRAKTLSQLAAAHINKVICNLTIENESIDFEILNGEDVYVWSEN